MAAELVPYEAPFAVFGPEADDFFEILEENTGSREFTPAMFRSWKWPGSGNDEWVHETADGREREAELVGVVIAQRKERVFFATEMSGDGGGPPDCFSRDGVNGHPATNEDGIVLNRIPTRDGGEFVFGGDCASCPLSKWESADAIGKGSSRNAQACAEYRYLYLVRPDRVLPEVVRLPPSALRTWSSIGVEMAQANRALSRTVISLGLYLPKGANTAELVVKDMGALPPEVGQALRAMAPKPQTLIAAAPAPEEEPARELTDDERFDNEIAEAAGDALPF